MEGVPQIGQMVFSRAGRDSGRPMVVVSVCDRRHVLVMDGSLRPGARPKRKNVRHLAWASAVHPGISAGRRVADTDVRNWLSQTAGPMGGNARPAGGIEEGQA